MPSSYQSPYIASNHYSPFTGDQVDYVVGRVLNQSNLGYTLTIGSVTTVPPESSASATITGPSPDQYLNLWIPRGYDGGGSGSSIDTATIRDIADQQISSGGYIVSSSVVYNSNVTVESNATVSGKLVVSSGARLVTSPIPNYAEIGVYDAGTLDNISPVARCMATDSSYLSATVLCDGGGAGLSWCNNSTGRSSFIVVGVNSAVVSCDGGYEDGSYLVCTPSSAVLYVYSTIANTSESYISAGWDGIELFTLRTNDEYTYRCGLALSNGAAIFDGVVAEFDSIADGLVEHSRSGTVLVNTDIVSGNSLLNFSSVSSSTSVVNISLLSGGTSYEYTQPLTSLTIASMVPNCHAQLLFSMSVDNAVTLPSGTILMPGDFQFTSGRNYILSISGNMVSANTYRIFS